MAEHSIAPATPEHAIALAKTMRKADVDEVWAAGHQEPLQALLASLSCSPEPWTALVDDEVICMFGVGTWSVLSDRGVPWMLASDTLWNHASDFLRYGHRYVKHIKGQYRLLENYVDARNTKSVRWLKLVGFRVEPAKPWGAEELPFHFFHWRAQ